jgi:hypothetical protein
MANLSTAKKLGIAARIAGRQVKRTRTYGALLSGARTTVGHLGGLLRQLWLEVTGFAFLAFAAVGVAAWFKEYAAYHFGKATVFRPVAAATFTLMFAWFGVSSFLRSRKTK